MRQLLIILMKCIDIRRKLGKLVSKEMFMFAVISGIISLNGLK